MSVLSAEEEVCRLRQQNLTLERQLGRLKCGRSQNPEDNDHSKLLERSYTHGGYAETKIILCV